jgi:excinuclease UvrABC helicase subunit UvrB
VQRAIMDMRGMVDGDYVDVDKLPDRMAKAADAKKKYVADVKIADIPKTVADMRKKMHAAAEDLDFEKAADLRDRIKQLEAIELAVR